ncbi:hypothetical protein FRC01_014596 [Tulasnella sp. 417]|nr:hypothetical protein FRC01_014596 [Tulasnella sp. 417]
MLPQEFISVASSAVGNAHAGLTGSSSLRPFGGIMNNIFFGDYHQFPPVRHENTALYKRTVPNAYAASGRGIMEQFTTVVLLTEQKRVPANSTWAQILSRARFGACNEEDIRFMKGLVLTNPSCVIPDFREPGWSSAVLVTSRNAVRIQWNAEAIRKWCATHQKPLFRIPCCDEIGRDKRSPTRSERRAIAMCREEQTGHLPSVLEIAEGMPVLVTFRHKKEASLSKGASATVKEIILDDDDAAEDQTRGLVNLSRLPKAIVLKLDHPPSGMVEGFARGEIPILPSTHRFQIHPNADKSKRTTVTRHQYGLVPAFSFTDYKSQGQTIDHVIVDIGKPGTGGISQFNAYVAISRGRGPEKFRFLRDFDSKLFTSGIDEDLAEEDRRLEGLNRVTKARYEKVIVLHK